MTLRLVDRDRSWSSALDADGRRARPHRGRLPHRSACTTWPPCRAAAHDVGALMVWDLAHSAGAMPVDLHGCRRRLRRRMRLQVPQRWSRRAGVRVGQPPARRPGQPAVAGWFGHDDPFEFAEAYRPAAGIARFQCGTPPILSLAALECGVDTVLAAEPLGGMAALRRKSVELTSMFVRADRSVARQRTSCRWRRLATPIAAAARSRCGGADTGVRSHAGADRARRDRRLSRT